MDNLPEDLLGVWKSDETGDPFMEFTDDGRFSGSDGCNGLGGEYTVEGDSVQVKRGGSTLMACPGVDDWLGKVSVVTIEGDTMTVVNRDGKEIGQLQRSAE